ARDGAADPAHGARSAGDEHVDGSAHRGGRGSGASGVVGERVYAGERHVPPLCRRVCSRHRRFRGSDRRRLVPARRGAHSRCEWRELWADLHLLWQRVCRRVEYDPHPRAEIATCKLWTADLTADLTTDQTADLRTDLTTSDYE